MVGEAEMTGIVWFGAALALAGIATILWCIHTIRQAQKSALSDIEMRLKLEKAVPLNSVAIFVAIIGLMIVVIGLLLR